MKAVKGKRLETHLGYLEFDGLLEREYGSRLETSRGEMLWALKPSIHDFVMKSERKTQIVYPKDLGLMAVRTGISPGFKVVEAGTGSGVLTMFLANLVRPSGHIYSYETREEFIPVARRNLERAGLLEYVTIENADAKQGLDVRDMDAAFIDVGDPWTLVSPMGEALKGGAPLAAISPTVDQIEKLVSGLETAGFVDIETVELLMRHLQVKQGMTRPETRMIGHTAYITFARKTLT